MRNFFRIKMKEKIMEELKKIECPFTTWGLDEINDIIIKHDEARTHDDEDFVPLLKWNRSLVEVYEFVQKKNLTEAKKSLKSAEEIWDSVKAKHAKNVSIEVLENIYKGTKCFLLMEEEKFDEINEILKTINKDIDYKNNLINKSTLNGCKSLAWSAYKDSGDLGIKKALELINLAINDNPNCAVWHFMLGKNLRRQRRFEFFFSNPTTEEETELKKAYALSKDPTYGIYLAQMYKEKGQKHEAQRIYEEIYRSKPESANIYLRLALGFIRTYKLPLAKECLDYAEKRVPEDSMFLHYKGIYLEKIRNYRSAAEYFKKASTGHNYAAEFSFLKCKASLKDKYDFEKHLQEMLITYENFESRVLDLTLQLAYFYYMRNNIPNAAKYYLKALEKPSKSAHFQRHDCIFRDKYDVYSFIRNVLLRCPSSDDETKEIFKKLQQICDDRDQHRWKKTELDFGNLKLS